ncbi:MAG TPA: S41 family peptidase [Gemmataceae bacterium]|nr:S41 family peptidase [Gemmataceae bacterium]
MSRSVRLIAAALAVAFAAPLTAAEIRLPRHPDYSEGRIVFSYLGDLWMVNDDGSNPRRLTVHAARDAHPKFSPDGKWIAFSSNRYGNDDVFVMPANGGPAKRLTYHSAPDMVVGWLRDSKRVVFNSNRGRVYGGIPSLYEVPIDGGAELPLPTDWGTYASFSPDGKQLAYNRHPSPWTRKHYRGSYCADLWLCDLDSKTSRKLLDADVPDDQKPNNLWPMFGKDAIYFVSDRETQAKAGTPEVMKSVNNIWKLSLTGEPPRQITHHTSGSLFWPSISADGRTIVYEENFGLCKLDVSNGHGQPVEVKIDIVTDTRENNLETKTVTSEADAYHLSPSGKRAVIAVEGDLFTVATDKGDPKRVTRSPGVRETAPQWSPDGKWIAFVSDESGREEIWLCDENGEHKKKISDVDAEKTTPTWSPDSKALLYPCGDKKLYKYTLDGDKTDVVAGGEVIEFGGVAISQPQWSPDGKWISYTKSDATLLPHVYVIPATGGAEKRITGHESYSDTNGLWTSDGKHIVYLSGMDVGNIGAPNRNNTAQIYAVSLVPEEKPAAEKGVDSEAEAAANPDRPGRGGAAGRGRPADGNDEQPPARGGNAKVDVKIDFDHLDRRVRQITTTADRISGITLSPDGKTVAFVTSGVEGGRSVNSIWTAALDGERTTRVTQGGAQTDEEGAPPNPFRFGFGGFSGLQYAKDGRTLYYRQGRGIYALSVGGGSTPTGGTPPAGMGGRGTGGGRRGGGAAQAAAPTSDTGSGSARRLSFTLKVEVDHAAQRKQVFGESWRVMKNRFYDPSMHGVNWDEMKVRYEPLLNYVADQADLHDVVNMMIGEMDASHTGISAGGGRGRGRAAEGDSDSTRFPGVELEPSNGFWKVTHVYRHGPADKDYIKIKVGDYVLAIDGQELTAESDIWKPLTAAGPRIELQVNSKPAKEGAWTVKITPVSQQAFGNLQYEKWVDDRRALVDKLSNGQIGYLHIRQMDETSLRRFEKDFAAQGRKKALIIDQRFNPGGNIDQELLEILQQKQYQYTRQRNSVKEPRPLRGFFGPMVVMENERSTSDAEVFPDGFKTLKLGKVVGMTTYGAVIGTGSYSLMDGSTIRTPGSGLWNVNGTNLENYGVPPDVLVDNTPDDFLKNRDAQIEKAVEVLKEEIKSGKKPAAGG